MSEGSDDEESADLKRITASKQETKYEVREKKEDKKVDEKETGYEQSLMHNCKKKGHFCQELQERKVQDYNYYKTKIGKFISAEETIAECIYKHDHDQSEVDHNESEHKGQLVDN
ncbi:hypothetical protein Tco_0099291 [Tanacetum coccineum]|uniref:Uncharacterized protein n=1 Tax=Tanacetum coccineum TaxID=301880 RepID=A0ABQ5ELR6_9ASTR